MNRTLRAMPVGSSLPRSISATEEEFVFINALRSVLKLMLRGVGNEKDQQHAASEYQAGDAADPSEISGENLSEGARDEDGHSSQDATEIEADSRPGGTCTRRK